MHLADDTDAAPLTSEAELVASFAAAGKPKERWRTGSEHELVGVRRQGGSAPGYDGPDGIRAVLDGFIRRGWTPIEERGHVIALAQGQAQITLEPGGQFELAARPVADDRDFASDLHEHISALAEISRPLGLTWLSTGLRPFGQRDDIPWMPKQRYEYMRAYMPTVGSRGLDMMVRTATVQTNLDFADEADALATMRCLLGVSSILTAIFANSPIVDGQATERQSHRAWIWRDTDRARCGLLPFVFSRDDLFTAYTEWALDLPLYFVYRGGYQPAGGLTFRQFLHQGWNGQRATMADWALHLSTVFPEARLKKVIEVRGCDCGSVPMIAALAPLCRGLVFDADAPRCGHRADRRPAHGPTPAGRRPRARPRPGHPGRSAPPRRPRARAGRDRPRRPEPGRPGHRGVARAGRGDRGDRAHPGRRGAGTLARRRR
jgi:glutamate--cysteine ligase